jgi:hypothetical protein
MNYQIRKQACFHQKIYYRFLSLTTHFANWMTRLANQKIRHANFRGERLTENGGPSNKNQNL